MQPKKTSPATLLSVLMVITVTLLVGCGQPNEQKASDTPAQTTTPEPAATTDATSPSANVATTTAAATTGNGEKVYQASCHVCHDTGNLGSPRIGDKAAWQPRIAQGKDVLYAHAIQGFTGKTGTMPPKGTSTAPDADIKSAVDYIVAKSQ